MLGYVRCPSVSVLGAREAERVRDTRKDQTQGKLPKVMQLPRDTTGSGCGGGTWARSPPFPTVARVTRR